MGQCVEHAEGACDAQHDMEADSRVSVFKLAECVSSDVGAVCDLRGSEPEDLSPAREVQPDLASGAQYRGGMVLWHERLQ
ncbi:hypothetical protein BIU99_00245 [Plantibacter sp. MMLR14_011]|nr:hypothetical protein BIU99_00245 [Plantibacter sp. MMLR14_011]